MRATVAQPQKGFFPTLIEAAKHRVIKAVGGRGFEIYVPPASTMARMGLADRQGNPTEMVKAFRSVVFSCINVRATEVANRGRFIPYLKKSNSEFSDIPVTHPLSLLMENPNAYFTKFYLWYLTICYLDLTGNSYWWIARDGMGTPRELWPLPSQKVAIVAGNPRNGEELIKGYTINWDGSADTFIPEEDVVHLRYPDPANPYYYGGSLVMRAAYEVDILDFVLKHWREFFANFAVPASVISFENEKDAEQLKAFNEEWRKQYGNKPGQVAAIGEKFTIQQLTSEQELGFLESVNIDIKMIRSVFRVPPSKLMETENIESRATAEVMDYSFQKETIDPLLTMIDQQLTTDLAIPEFGEKFVIRHESTIPLDRKAQAELDAKDLASGTTSINEIRLRDGKEPVKGGDEPLVSYNLVPLSSVTAPTVDPNAVEPVAGKLAAKGKSFIVKNLTEAQKTAIWKAHDAFRARQEIRMSRSLKKYFNQIRDDVVARIESGKSAKAGELTADEMNFDVNKWLNALLPLMSKESMRILEAAFADFVKRYSVEGVVFAPNDPKVNVAIARVNAKATTIPATLHDQLQAQIEEGVRLNETPAQIAERVKTFFGNTNDYRSIRIARTVSNYAVNEANRIAAADSGFTKKSWLSMRDEKVRDLHLPMDGVEILLVEKFELANGDLLDVPGDPDGRAESVINCRCGSLFSKN